MDSYLIVLTLKYPSLRDTSDKDRDILICVFKGNNLHYSTENFHTQIVSKQNKVDLECLESGAIQDVLKDS